jgi:hypothetical protein
MLASVLWLKAALNFFMNRISYWAHTCVWWFKSTKVSETDFISTERVMIGIDL